jgi:hypothetical protein
MHLFGGFGVASLVVSFIAMVAAVFFKVVKLAGDRWFSRDFVAAFGKDFVETPLPVLIAIFFVTGVLSILMGLLAEMVMRTYFESQGKTTYRVRRPG